MKISSSLARQFIGGKSSGDTKSTSFSYLESRFRPSNCEQRSIGIHRRLHIFRVAGSRTAGWTGQNRYDLDAGRIHRIFNRSSSLHSKSCRPSFPGSRTSGCRKRLGHHYRTTISRLRLVTTIVCPSRECDGGLGYPSTCFLRDDPPLCIE